MIKQLCRTCWATLFVVGWASATLSESFGATSFGINFRGDIGGWGPYSLNAVGAHGAGPYPSAFGVEAANWYEPDAVSVSPATGFSSPSMNGGSVDISFSAFPDNSFSAYGYANANQAVNNGIPESGEYAVLAGYLFGTGEQEYGEDWAATPVVIEISGLGSIASANGILQEYKVTLLASSANGADVFLSADVSDSDSNSNQVEFDIFAEHPDYNFGDPNFTSAGGMGMTSIAMTGDDLTITVEGWNETGSLANGDYTRSSIAGVIVTFIPEPSSIILAGIAALALSSRGRRFSR